MQINKYLISIHTNPYPGQLNPFMIWLKEHITLDIL